MSLSVIIPAYNYAHFLPRTLHSVLNQPLAVPLEVIVVDDGSTDSTARAARRFEGKIKYIYQENQGLSAARNTGMAHARGEALLFLDADDLLLPNTLQSQWDTLQAHPDASISVCLNYTFRARQPGDNITIHNCIPLPRAAFGVHMCAFNVAPPHSHIVRRAVAKNAGLFDTSLRACEDYDFWLRCLAAQAQVVLNTATAVLYRQHEKSMSAQTANQLAFEALCNQRVARILQSRPEFLAHRRLDAHMAHLYGSLMRACKLCDHATPSEELVEQARNAASTICQLCPAPLTMEDMVTACTTVPRTQEEIHVLDYYTKSALHILKNMFTQNFSLEKMYDALSHRFPHCITDAQSYDEAYKTGYLNVYIPQSRDAIADKNGALRIRV